MKQRKLFCQISPLTYRISKSKNIMLRQLKDLFCKRKFTWVRSNQILPVVNYSHSSLIRRILGNTEVELQENKAINLSIAAPKVNGIMIHPGETFSFWRLVGPDSEKRGYKEGLTISSGHPSKGVGGGLCQLTNLIHWMILHSELSIIEHHHHDGIDLFPDFNRQIPFGTGTSIVYNYLDYRFVNRTNRTYQLLVWTDGEYLRGELRSDFPQDRSFHIHVENEYFSQESDGVYRNGTVYRDIIDKRTGNCLSHEILRRNHARVMYDTSNLVIKSTI